MKFKFQISSIIILVLMICLVLYLAFSVDEDTKTTITKIELSGGRSIENNDYLKFARLDNQKDFKDLDLRIIRDRIAKHPYVKRVNLQYQKPVVKIIITEKKFNGIMITDLKKYLVTSTFEILPYFENIRESNLPLLLNVKLNEKVKVFNSLKKNVDVVTSFKMLSAMKVFNADLFNDLSEINFRNGGDIILNMAAFDYPLVIGRGNEINKIACLAKIWNYLRNNQLNNIINYIDLRYKGNIYIGFSDANSEQGNEV